MKLDKLKPWNWFKKEEEENQIRSGEIVPYRSDRHRHQFALNRIHDEFDRIFDEMMGGAHSRRFPLSTESGAFGEMMNFRPILDISESSDHYEIEVEVPGAEKGDVKVEHVDGSLVISGEKKKESEEKEKDFHRVERSHGSFRRVLDLPPDADGAQVDARFKNGVLTLSVPKIEVTKAPGGQVIEIHD